jgi:hypothetical protein
MNSIQINEILKKDDYARKYFLGVFSRDKIPKISKSTLPCSMVINTHESDKPGEHWLALFYDANGNCDFFDSLAFSPNFYNFKQFFNKNALKISFSNKPIQSLFSDFCGYYCVLFLLFRSRHISLDNFLKFFDFNKTKNDNYLKKLIEEN